MTQPKQKFTIIHKIGKKGETHAIKEFRLNKEYLEIMKFHIIQIGKLNKLQSYKITLRTSSKYQL